ncbi:MAG TPA: hypothetical protein VHB21_21060, partial [Minicystis sp.]|nr:hypothetical protein [Minicystis sp.]
MRALVACSALVLGLTAPSLASAYALQQDAAGDTVRWRDDALTMVVDGSVDALAPGARDAVAAAFATWDAVPDVSMPEVTVASGAVDDVGYRPGDANQNTVRYLPGGYLPAGDALAITIATYDETGAIVDADVVINGMSGRVFAVLDPGAVQIQAQGPFGMPYDLQDV